MEHQETKPKYAVGDRVLHKSDGLQYVAVITKVEQSSNGRWRYDLKDETGQVYGYVVEQDLTPTDIAPQLTDDRGRLPMMTRREHLWDVALRAVGISLPLEYLLRITALIDLYESSENLGNATLDDFARIEAAASKEAARRERISRTEMEDKNKDSED